MADEGREHHAECLSQRGGTFCDCRGIVHPIDQGREQECPKYPLTGHNDVIARGTVLFWRRYACCVACGSERRKQALSPRLAARRRTLRRRAVTRVVLVTSALTCIGYFTGQALQGIL